MSFLKNRYLTFCVLFAIFQFRYSVSALEECRKDDFESGDFGILNLPCLSMSAFKVSKYEDRTDVLDRPPGSNEFFIAPPTVGRSCIESSEYFKIENGTDISFRVFTNNPSGIPIVATWRIHDMEDSIDSLMQSSVLLFSNSNNGWKTVRMNIPRSANKARIRLNVDEVPRGRFFAVDYMKIKPPHSEDC